MSESEVMGVQERTTAVVFAVKVMAVILVGGLT